MRKFVRVIIKDDNNRQLVLKHSSKQYDSWNYPGGKVERGEKSEDAAVREVYEEIGVTVLKLKHLTSLCIDIEGKKWEGIFYFAEKIGKESPMIKEPSKFSALEFCAPKALRSLSEVPCLLSRIGNSAQVGELRPSRLES